MFGAPQAFGGFGAGAAPFGGFGCGPGQAPAFGCGSGYPGTFDGGFGSHDAGFGSHFGGGFAGGFGDVGAFSGAATWGATGFGTQHAAGSAFGGFPDQSALFPGTLTSAPVQTQAQGGFFGAPSGAFPADFGAAPAPQAQAPPSPQPAPTPMPETAPPQYMARGPAPQQEETMYDQTEQTLDDMPVPDGFDDRSPGRLSGASQPRGLCHGGAHKPHPEDIAARTEQQRKSGKSAVFASTSSRWSTLYPKQDSGTERSIQNRSDSTFSKTRTSAQSPQFRSQTSRFASEKRTYLMM